MLETDKILGSCDCVEGPVVRSFVYPEAKYLHVETARGVRCCRQTDSGEILYGSVIKLSGSEIESRKKALSIVEKAQVKLKDRKQKIQELKKKRLSNVEMTSDDLHILFDAMLGND